MMKRVFFCFTFFAVIFTLLTIPVFASHKSNSKNDNIPEKNGLYDDPDHPGIKVKVFVHPEKPERVAASSLVCGLSDPNSSAIVSAGAWHLPSAWSYNLNPSSVPSSVGSGNLATIATNGFSDWSSATGNRVDFSRGSDTTVTRQAYDGRNIVSWGRTSGSALGTTYIRYYSSSGLVVDVDTILNKKFAWTWANSNSCAYADTYDAEDILNHELGHWIGMNDEYDANNFQYATMFGYGSKGEVMKVTLTDGDSVGAYSIYNP